ncbi:MAG: SRPBCC family protein [Pseudomonadota bacterium]
MRASFVIATLALLAACSEAGPPSIPPTAPPPPEVATTGFVRAQATATVPMSVPELRAFMAANPLIDFLEPTDNIAPPVASQVLSGTWPQPGATRWLRLSDGHYVVERVLQNNPDLFRYQIFLFTNSVGRGVDQIVGEQRFLAQPDGSTRIEWDYDVKARNALTRLFVRQQIDEIDAYITGGLDGLAAAATAAAG